MDARCPRERRLYWSLGWNQAKRADVTRRSSQGERAIQFFFGGRHLDARRARPLGDQRDRERRGAPRRKGVRRLFCVSDNNVSVSYDGRGWERVDTQRSRERPPVRRMSSRREKGAESPGTYLRARERRHTYRVTRFEGGVCITQKYARQKGADQFFELALSLVSTTERDCMILREVLESVS